MFLANKPSRCCWGNWPNETEKTAFISRTSRKMLFWGKQIICRPSEKLISSDYRKLRWGWKQKRDRKLRYWEPSQACLPSLHNQKQTHISLQEAQGCGKSSGCKWHQMRMPTLHRSITSYTTSAPKSAPPWLLESESGYWCRQAAPPGGNRCSWSPLQTTEGKFTSTRRHWPIPRDRSPKY